MQPSQMWTWFPRCPGLSAWAGANDLIADPASGLQFRTRKKDSRHNRRGPGQGPGCLRLNRSLSLLSKGRGQVVASGELPLDGEQRYLERDSITPMRE